MLPKNETNCPMKSRRKSGCRRSGEMSRSTATCLVFVRSARALRDGALVVGVVVLGEQPVERASRLGEDAARFADLGGRACAHHLEGLSLIHISEPTRLLSISYA